MAVFQSFCPIRAFIGQNCQKRNNDCIRLIKGHLAWENDKNVEKEQNSGHIHFLGVWGRGKKRNSQFSKLMFLFLLELLILKMYRKFS